jgi:queuine tRNA-ribosyltransferase
MQGGIHEDLRRISASGIESQDFFGSAVGGCYGGSEEEMVDVISYALQLLTKERPVHLLGIGRIQDIFTFVRYGVETFDCVVPPRMARHGWALGKGVPSGRMNLRNAQYALDQTPLDEYSPLALSRTYSRGYLHHLIKANESLAGKILTLHNVAVMNRLMAEIRVAIKEGTLDQLEKEWIFD